MEDEPNLTCNLRYIIFFVKTDKLQKLLQLQQVELEIIRVQTALQKLLSQISDTSKKIEEIKGKRENIEKGIEELKKEIKRQKETIQECKEGAKRAEERLGLVKKVEEYKALLREKARYEDCVIKLTNSLKDLEEKLKKLQEERDDKKFLRELQELEEELSDLRYSQSRLISNLDELRKEFQKLRENTESNIVQEYENLKKKYGLPIILSADSFGACTNCGTKLPSALYSRLIKGEVVICPSCGRLLYYEGEA